MLKLSNALPETNRKLIHSHVKQHTLAAFGLHIEPVRLQILDCGMDNVRIAVRKVERTVLQKGRRYGILVINPAFDNRRSFESG